MRSEEEFEELNKQIKEAGAEAQHQKGKLTAIERINLLVDEDSFVELDPFIESTCSDFGMDKKKVLGDGVITGFARISKRQVYIYSQDFTKIGGSLGKMHAEKIVKILDLALKTGAPVIGIIDSGGARIQEGIDSLDGYAKVFKKMVQASGVIPQITVIAGPSAGGASYSPGLSDFIFMVEKIGQMYITGSEVIKLVTGEDAKPEDLGGAQTHSEKSGCAHFVCQSEEECFLKVKQLFEYLPNNNMDDPPQKTDVIKEFFGKSETDFSQIVPQDEQKPYDIKLVIENIFDKDSFIEVQKDFAKNVVVGFCLLHGKVVGVVANQPKVFAGVLDIDSSDKVSRFVRFCDSFNIPLINLVDIPGYLPGIDQEQKGIIRHGAKILYSIAEATVPKISLILRKAYGGAYIALVSRDLGYDRIIAWPNSKIGIMGPEQAVGVINRKELAQAKDCEKLKEKRIEEYKENLNCFNAAKQGKIDMIINPKDTRKVLIKTLFSLKNKREPKIPRKHGNMPL